jgi:hypothetical protein
MVTAGVVPRRILAAFLAIDLAFGAAFAAMIAAGMTGERIFRAFNLDLEMNPPTWYSAMQLLLVALVCYLLVSKPFALHPRVRPLRGAFAGLAALFTYLSLDEGGVVHERISDLLGARWYLPALHGRGLVMAALYVVALAVVVVAVWRYARPAARLWPRQSLLFLTGCGLVVAGGIVSEVIVRGLGLHFGTLGSFVEIGLEEVGEMAGVTLALYAVVTILAVAARDILALAAPEGAQADLTSLLEPSGLPTSEAADEDTAV